MIQNSSLIKHIYIEKNIYKIKKWQKICSSKKNNNINTINDLWEGK